MTAALKRPILEADIRLASCNYFYRKNKEFKN